MALKTIKMSIDQPTINEGSSTTHASTSWEVSLLPDFSNEESIVLRSLEDTENLIEYRFNYDMRENEPLYLRTKFFFNDGNHSNWSKIVPLNSNQVGIKLSSTIVVTPVMNATISYDNDSSGELVCTGTTMRLYSGIGTHVSTSWEILDTDNNIIYERVYDVDNLTEIRISPDILDKNKIYIVKAKYHTNTNAESNYGQTFLTTNTGSKTLFDLSTPYKLVPNKWLYFELKLYTTKFKNLDIVIEDLYGKVIAENLGQTSKTPRIYTGELERYKYYVVKARITLTTDFVTEYVTVISTNSKLNTLIDYSDTIGYLDKQSFLQELMLGGGTTQSSHEIYNDSILLCKHDEPSIYNYKYIGDKLVEVGPVISLEGEDTIMKASQINLLPMHNGYVMLDYTTTSDEGILRKPIFKLYDHNVYTNEFTLMQTIEREDELGSTGISASAAMSKENVLYYIPAGLVDENNERVNLKLRSYDTITETHLPEIDLPFTTKRHTNLIITDDNKLIVLGGSIDRINDDTTGDVTDNIDVFNRDNNKVFSYDIEVGNWTELFELPETVPSSVYNFQAYLRRDEKIVLFNAVNSGDSVGDQSTYVLNLTNGTVIRDNNDFEDNIVYRNSVVMRSGDILRISSRAVDPQKVYRYVSNTITAEEVIDNTTINEITDLVIPSDEVITIESPYVYESITINEGGVLRWLDGDIVREFTSKDLIITRDTTLDLTDSTWQNIIVLDDVTFDVL